MDHITDAPLLLLAVKKFAKNLRTSFILQKELEGKCQMLQCFCMILLVKGFLLHV